MKRVNPVTGGEGEASNLSVLLMPTVAFALRDGSTRDERACWKLGGRTFVTPVGFNGISIFLLEEICALRVN